MPKHPSLNHLAIIMDGNRRWATEHGLSKLFGHTEGAKTLKKIAQAVSDKGIQYLTVWALSTENLKERSEKELKHLFSLFEQLTDYLGDFIKNNARFKLIGDLSQLPKKTQTKLLTVVEKTKQQTKMTLTLAVNYGGRDEIVRAVRKIVETRQLVPTETLGASSLQNQITEELFSKFLDIDNIPDPDLIIRTGGHHRLSGFMAWQSTYAELFFTNTFWPAFKVEELNRAIAWFEEQVKNRGK